MCGIAGIISSDPSLITEQRLKKMTDAIVHRGPESEAFWMKQHIGFGHRRLCIIDLSSNAAQPMHYLGRYTVVFNGEIYNYLEIKTTLQQKGFQFTSHSDTEVLVAAYAHYKEACLQYFDGMFAFAIWDQEEQKLFAARDRFGEKPFFYCINEKERELFFASEIKALLAAGASRDYDGTMLLNYLALGWTEHPTDKKRTFYKNIYALPAGHFLTQQVGASPVITSYWSLNTNVTFNDNSAAVASFSSLFHESVSKRLRSDVPIGTSLSGGLDSSSVIASASRSSNSLYTHKSFSAVFPGFEKDESAYVRLVADRYQLENFSSTPDAAALASEFSTFMHFHDEPVLNPSAFAQYKVYQLAKSHGVTVLLDGQGADEVLAGYSKYINWYLQDLWRTNSKAFRKEKTALEKNGIPFTWSLRHIIAATMPAIAAEQLHLKALKQLQSFSYVDEQFTAAFLDRESLYKPVIKKLNDVLAFNCSNFGLGELLRYADTNAMANSTEVRLPFLNHDLVSFVFSLPSQMKIHEGWSKWLLRKTMAPYLPPEITWRKDKIGFEPPTQSWMNDERMQVLVRESKTRLVDRKILNATVLDKKNQPPVLTAADSIDWRLLVADALIK